jgi:hypothetical protein
MELQGVRSGAESHLGFSLTGAEMQMIWIARDWLFEWRQIGIDQQVMMAGVISVGAGGRHSHVSQSKMDDRPGLQRVSRLYVDEINRGPWRRRARAAPVSKSVVMGFGGLRP